MRRTRRSAALALLVLLVAACTRKPESHRPPLKAAADDREAAAGAPRPADAASGVRPRATALALGDAHSCALLEDGTVRCWGLGESGRLGLGSTASIGDDEPASAAPAVDVGGKVVAISAGEAHTCALLATGAVRCWGSGSEGQLGYGRADNIGDDESPASVGDIPLGEKAVAVAAGGFATCVLLTSGAVRCWGRDNGGRLGLGSLRPGNLGDDEPVESVAPFKFSRRVVQLASAASSSCVLFDDGAVHCWGFLFGSVDEPAKAGSTADVDVGVPAEKLSFTPTAMGGCVITTAGAARCWGLDRILDDPVGIHSDMTAAPAQLGDLPLRGRLQSVHVGGEHGCALLDSGEVRCWGSRRLGLLGWPSGYSVAPEEAVRVELGAPATAVAASTFHSCAITRDGAVHCWGLGENGRLGYGTTENIGESRSPTAAVPLSP